MRRAFTLIEMLIVVAVLATLMTLVFRITADGDAQTRRITTIARLQRLENCLSGYYAAYGGYPPVALHGSRDIYSEVNDVGVQKSDGSRSSGIWNWTKIGESAEKRAWKQVRAACLSQPVACNFPFQSEPVFQLMIDQWSELCMQAAEAAGDALDEDTRAMCAAGFSGLGTESSAAGELNRYKAEVDWRELQLFRFGLMSYLLPRYILMTGANQDFYSYAQWTENNVEPSDPFTGNKMTWNSITSISQDWAKDDADKGGRVSKRDKARLGNIPSQKICPRWLPNLEKICTSAQGRVVYGVQIDEGGGFPPTPTLEMSADGESATIKGLPTVFTPGGRDGNRDQYVLDSVTVRDGWGNDFFYYSPSPHQRYQIWSGGANERTFPPWVAREGLPANANECIHKWTVDDIMQMTN